jgi:hypothetical protein
MNLFSANFYYRREDIPLVNRMKTNYRKMETNCKKENKCNCKISKYEILEQLSPEIFLEFVFLYSEIIKSGVASKDCNLKFKYEVQTNSLEYFLILDNYFNFIRNLTYLEFKSIIINISKKLVKDNYGKYHEDLRYIYIKSVQIEFIARKIMYVKNVMKVN